jgi:ABC-type nickel/cobalt efflux system permease component RcnA
VTEEQAAPKKRSDPTSQLARGELVHAEVKPLDLSGIPTVIVGIIAWAVAFVVLLIFRDELKEHGLEWWLWVTVAGFGLGLIGLWYCRRRWNAIKAAHHPETED